jgi:hypothetical protein
MSQLTAGHGFRRRHLMRSDVKTRVRDKNNGTLAPYVRCSIMDDLVFSSHTTRQDGLRAAFTDDGQEARQGQEHERGETSQ